MKLGCAEHCLAADICTGLDKKTKEMLEREEKNG